MVNEADMDFQIPGLPHSVVKNAQSTNVRELIQKIGNHPDRHALQQDLRQNQSFNLFSPESKQMIQDVGNIELCELLETEPKRSAQCVYHTGISVYSTARAGISCIKKEGPIKNSSIIRWTFFQSLSMSSRREDLMDIDMVKKLGDKEYYLSNQLKKKKWKKKKFQGIHDRFIRDQELLNRMIENHRDEDLCRRWDALADEDHTHHLTAQEYLHYGGFIQKKQGSNTLPLRHRSDFKQTLSILQRLREEAGEEPQVPYLFLQTPTTGGTQFIFYMVELARLMVDSSSFRKSRRRCTKY